MREIFVDARELEHPLPLEKAIEALKELDDSSYFYMLHRKEPIPLLALASEHKLNYFSKEISGVWHILITPNLDCNLEEFVDVSK